MNRQLRSIPTDKRPYNSLGLQFSGLTFAEVVADALRRHDMSRLYITCNLNHLRVLQNSRAFQEAYKSADVVTIDGNPLRLLVWRETGQTPDLVTGSDLFTAIFRHLRPEEHRPFFLTSSDAVGAALGSRLELRGFREGDTAYVSPAFGFEESAKATSDLLAQILEHRTTHLFLGVGAPKSEIWASRVLHKLESTQVFCFGAALEFEAATKPRAPQILRRSGLEWLHRAVLDPRRLAKRYYLDAIFLVKLLSRKQRLKQIVPFF